MKSSTHLSRRSFLSRAAAAAAAGAVAAPSIVPASALGANGAVAPSERITLGFIGVGDHGVNRNLKRFLPEPDAQVLAVCDVDRGRSEDAKRIVEERFDKDVAANLMLTRQVRWPWHLGAIASARGDCDAPLAQVPQQLGLSLRRLACRCAWS